MELKLFAEWTSMWVVYHLRRVWNGDGDESESDRGDVPGWVIIFGITVLMAAAIGAAMYLKVRNKADSITIQ